MKKKYILIQGRDAAFKKYLLFASLCLLWLPSFAWQGGSLACNNLIQVSLDYDCQAQITPDMMLEGDNYNFNLYTVTISGIVGDIVTQPGAHTVTVTEISSGNSCWGNILVEDKLPPVIEECPCEQGNDDPDCQFLCSDLGFILNGDINPPAPTVHENCGFYYTNKSDKVIDNGCDGRVIQRTWKFTDEYGNMSPVCTTYYYLAPVGLGDVSPPDNKIDLPCGNGVSEEDIFNYFLPLIGIKAATYKAWPTIGGAKIENTGPCNIVATKSDITALACDADCPKSFKMIRTWSIIDWCANEDREFAQIISTKDKVPPTIQGSDVTKSVDPWGCYADIVFPPPSILHDECSDSLTYNVTGPAGIQIFYFPGLKRYVAKEVPKGKHKFFYNAYDCCDNKGVDTVEVNVLDQTSPVAISKEFIVVSLTKEKGDDGIAKIYPPSIDNGSHDGCTAVHLEIRRDEGDCGHIGNTTYNNDGHPNDHPDDPDGGNFVKFCCDDLTDVSADGVPFGRVKVWLRVWDDGDMDGVFGSAGDNYNETWSWVRVEDKLPPTIVCPPDVTIECYEDVDNLDVTGRATGSYTCSLGNVEYTDIDNTNSCGFGYIIRRWKLINNTSTCTQRITIKDGAHFDPSTIVWPPNETTTCNNIHDYQVTWSGAPCALLGVSVDADTFQFVEGVCLKIINKYTLVDWCVYDPNNPSSGGMWTHTQIVKVRDDKAPIIDCEDLMFEASDFPDSDNDGNTCEARNLVLTNSADDEGDCSSKWLRWQVFVDLWGDGVSDYEYSSFLPSNDHSFNDTNNNGVPDIYLAASNSGQQISITIPEDIEGSMSNHKVTWKVTDGCGNHRSCTTNFMVVDKKKPTPYCISLSTAVMDDGTVELWARDFDKGSFDNCSEQENLRFTFNNESPVASKMNTQHFFKGNGQTATALEFESGDAQKWVPGLNSSSKIFNCDDLPEVEVKMTVYDEKGNSDFCIVILSLVDNQDACDGGNRIAFSGQILNSKGQGMENVEVSLMNDQLLSYPRYTNTDADGRYAFLSNPPDMDYHIGVRRVGDYRNGVSTLDLVLMQRHILGTEFLNNPYKAIAADVNGDGKIRTSDLVELRKLILGVTDKFDNEISWRFIDSSQDFGDPNNPWPFVEVMGISNANTDKNGVNFVGQKIGDVNESAKANVRDADSDTRNKSIAKFYVEDAFVHAGESIRLPLKSATAVETYGMQFTLENNGLIVDRIESLAFEADGPTYYTLTSGRTNVAFAGNAAVRLDENQSVCTLMLTATRDGMISEMLDISSSELTAELYDANFSERPIQLVFRSEGDVVGGLLQLVQNEPNPFSDKTLVRFELPSAGEVDIRLIEADGKTVWAQTQHFAKGANALELNKDQFPHSGVYICQLKFDTYTSSIKMIYLK